MGFLVLLLISLSLTTLALLLELVHHYTIDALKMGIEHPSDHGVEILQTQILRCNISHSRLFPKKHHFIYPYLSVGIPVRNPRSNWLLSIDTQNWWRRGWLHVTGNDHLHRLNQDATVSEKLNNYLRQQVIVEVYVSL